MKKTLIVLLCLGLFSAQGDPIHKGTVVVVYDGDTVKVRPDTGLERRVRLIGIDTPEIEDEPADTRLEALLAKRFTFYHLFRKSVELTYERELEDRYGRLLAYVWSEAGLFNEFILQEGFARVFLKFPFGMEGKFIRAQKQAQEQGRGFWQKEPYPIITPKIARNHIGTLRRVRFKCTRIRKSGRLHFLHEKSGNFAAVIPKEYIHLFGDIRELKDKTVQVSGFLEEYRGQPQIMLFLPSQLQIGEDRI
jgi:micrococcal nuclease